MRSAAGFLTVPAASLIGAILELGKKFINARVPDRLARGVWLQMALCHIRHMFRTVNQYLVPGLVFGRATAGYLLIPFFATLEVSVDIDNDSTVSELEVVYNLTNGKTGFCCHLFVSLDARVSLAGSVLGHLMLGPDGR